MVQRVAERVGLDVGAVHPHLGLLHAAECVADLGLAGADRLDLGPLELDPGLETLPHLKITENLGVPDLRLARWAFFARAHGRRRCRSPRTAALTSAPKGALRSVLASLEADLFL